MLNDAVRAAQIEVDTTNLKGKRVVSVSPKDNPPECFVTFEDGEFFLARGPVAQKLLEELKK